MSQNKLPTLAELYADNIEQAQRIEDYTRLLAKDPKPEWVKKHPFGGYFYLPIDKVEYLLKMIFKQYKIEVLETKQMFNGVTCTVRVHYVHPVTGEWSYHDGVGAEALQTKKGTSAADMININTNALAMALPIAKASAVKNACFAFGALFGANLNRRDTLGYTGDKSILNAPIVTSVSDLLKHESNEIIETVLVE